MRDFKLSLIIIVFLHTSLFAQTVLNNPDDIKNIGKENSIEYKKSLISLSEAEDDIIGLFNIQKTRVSVGSFGDPIDGDWDIDSSISIPIIDQISLSGSLDMDLKGNIGVTIKPFEHSTTREISDINLKSQIVSTKTAELNSKIDAVVVVLDWMSAKRNFELQTKLVNLNDIIYSDNKDRYESGNITLDELKDSLITWSESRKQLLNKQQIYTLAGKSLYSTLAVSDNEIEIKSFSVSEIELYLDILKNEIDLAQADFLKSSSYIQSTYSVLTSKIELDNTWNYEPDLKAGVNMVFDKSAEYDFSGSINFSISLDDFSVNERERKLQEYDLVVAEHQLEINDVKLDFTRSIDLLKSSEIDTSIINIEYEQAIILYEEAKLLYSAGDYSEIELEESKLYVNQVENDLFDSLSKEYNFWMEFLKYL